jgi:hypothetical protein
MGRPDGETALWSSLVRFRGAPHRTTFQESTCTPICRGRPPDCCPRIRAGEDRGAPRAVSPYAGPSEPLPPCGPPVRGAGVYTKLTVCPDGAGFPCGRAGFTTYSGGTQRPQCEAEWPPGSMCRGRHPEPGMEPGRRMGDPPGTELRSLPPRSGGPHGTATPFQQEPDDMHKGSAPPL